MMSGIIVVTRKVTVITSQSKRAKIARLEVSDTLYYHRQKEKTPPIHFYSTKYATTHWSARSVSAEERGTGYPTDSSHQGFS